MPAEKSVSKASENRRSNKPLMEKRRRARINQSLTELKALILDAVKKDSSRHSKLEKADILEMTVKYLQNLQKQQTSANPTTESSLSNRFRAGFGECASEVSRFLESAEGFEAAVRTRLLGHLTSYLNGLERSPSTPTVPSSTGVSNSSVSSSSSTVTSSAEPSPRATPSPGIIDGTTSPPPPPPRERTASPTIASDVDINNNNTSGTNSRKTCSVSTTTTIDSVFSGLQLIPTRLANGEIAFILPTHYAVAAAQALALGRIETLPVLPVSSAADSVSSWSRTEQGPENSRFTQTRCEPKSDSDLKDGDNSTSPRTVDSDTVGRPATSPQEKQPLFMSLDDSVWRPW